MKKPTAKKLVLDRQTLRTLPTAQLGDVAGGQRPAPRTEYCTYYPCLSW